MDLNKIIITKLYLCFYINTFISILLIIRHQKTDLEVVDILKIIILPTFSKTRSPLQNKFYVLQQALLLLKTDA